MTLYERFQISDFFFFYRYVKDIGQGFRLPEILNFNKCELWMIVCCIMKWPFM